MIFLSLLFSVSITPNRFQSVKGLLTIFNETDFPLFIIMVDIVYSTLKLVISPLKRSISASDHTHIPTGEHTLKFWQSIISVTFKHSVLNIKPSNGPWH